MKKALIPIVILMAFLVGCASGSDIKSDQRNQLPGNGVATEPPDDDTPPNVTDDPSQDSNTSKKLSIKIKNNILNCVYSEDCNNQQITAKGGSGEYEWKIDGLPQGLELKEGDKPTIKSVEGKPAALGKFEVVVGVTDKSDETKKAEKKFFIKVKEDIAINVYEKKEKDGEWEWVDANTAEDDAGNVEGVKVAPGKMLKLEVVGHADEYTWKIDNWTVAEDSDSDNEKNTKDGISLVGGDLCKYAPRFTGKKCVYKVRFIKVQPEFMGKKLDVVISAEDANGSKDSITLTSLVFEEDPCKTPLSVKVVESDITDLQGREFGKGDITAKVGKGQEYKLKIKIEGGKGPYEGDVIVNTDIGTSKHYSSTFNETQNYNFEFSNNLAQADWTLEVTDSCPTPNKLKQKVIFEQRCSLGKMGDVKMYVHYSVSPDADHDVCDETDTQFFLLVGDKVNAPASPKYYVDKNDNGTIDDISPVLELTSQEVCLEDVKGFRWWFNAEAGAYYPDVTISNVLVVGKSGDKTLYAGWSGELGGEDLDGELSWEGNFNQKCDYDGDGEKDDIWCKDDPFPGSAFADH